MQKYLLLFFLSLGAALASAKDIKTLVVTTTPQMHCANCENKIKNNLRFEKGVKKIDTNVAAQTVTIEYDADKTMAEDLVKAFSKFGYQARPLKEGETVKANEAHSSKEQK